MKAGEKPGLPRFKPHSWFRPIELYAGADRFLQVNAGGTKATIRIKGLPAMRLRLHRPVARGSAPGHPHHQDTAAGGGVPGVCARGPSTGGSGDGAPVGIDAGVAKRITLSDGRHVDRRELDRRKLRRLQRRVARAKRGSPDVARKSRRWLESGSASPSTTVVTSTKWPRPLMRQANARAGHHLYQGLARRLQNPPPCSTQSRHRWPACPRAAQSLKQRNPATAAAGFRRGGLSRRPTPNGAR